MIVYTYLETSGVYPMDKRVYLKRPDQYCQRGIDLGTCGDSLICLPGSLSPA